MYIHSSAERSLESWPLLRTEVSSCVRGANTLKINFTHEKLWWKRNVRLVHIYIWHEDRAWSEFHMLVGVIGYLRLGDESLS